MYIGAMTGGQRIVVIGLGYVGLPLAVALARHFETIGFEIDEGRVFITVARGRGPIGAISRMERGGFGRRAKARSVLALVSGPPGQGKTRLVEEFLGGNPGLRLLAARCRPGGEVGALAPLRELLIGDRGEDALSLLIFGAI